MASVSVNADSDVNGAPVDFKQKYKLLKNKMKFLVYEHEALLDDLKKAQKKLLHVSRDRSFLLDRLLGYEKIEDSSSDEDAGVSSDSDSEKAPAKAGKKADAAVPEKSRKRESTKVAGEPPKKRLKTIKRPRGGAAAAATAAAAVGTLALAPKSTSTPQSSREDVERRRGELRSKAAAVPPLSREEIERHLESRPRLLALEKAPLHMPAEIFSNEASNADSDDATSDNDLDQSDLIIDSKWDV